MAVNRSMMTNGKDLKTLIRSCKKCSELTKNGDNVISHSELKTTYLPNSRKKHGFIVNSSSDPSKFGHWFSIIVSPSSDVYLCDGLDYIRKLPDVMNSINQFCIINNCSLKVLPILCQQNNTSVCGYISLYFIARFSTMSVRNFCNLAKIFRNNSIKTNESIVMRYVQLHYNFRIKPY